MFLTLAACVPSDPEYQEEKAAQRAASSANSSKLVAAEFGPLMPICLETLTKGAPLNEGKLAAMGYKKSVGAYVKPRGTKTIDRINMVNTTFTANARKCVFGLGNFAGVQEAGKYVAGQLEARGYKASGSNKKGFLYVRGPETLVLNGFFYSTSTNVSLVKN